VSELKACPFCNGEARVRQVHADEWVIECISPLMPLCAANIGQQNGLPKAYAAWNRRAHDASDTQELRAANLTLVEGCRNRDATIDFLQRDRATETAALRKVRDEMADPTYTHTILSDRMVRVSLPTFGEWLAALDAILGQRK